MSLRSLMNFSSLGYDCKYISFLNVVIMEQISNRTDEPRTIGDELDRIEILVGKIGMIGANDALAILYSLDELYPRIQAIESESSRKIVEGQLEGILARIEKEAGQLIRDVGGTQRYEEARREAQPPAEHWWWYLDERLAEKRKHSLRRSLIVLAGIVLVVTVLGLVYQFFLAPSPEVAARYRHEQTARDLLMNGDPAGALEEVNEGLTYGEDDPQLLILKGVIYDSQGQTEEAEQAYAQAEKGFTNRVDFLVQRGQDYILTNQMEKALKDGQEAVSIAPDQAQGYLLVGQAYEMLGEYREALDAYEKCFEVAEATDEAEIAAYARVRIAMLVQSMSAPVPTQSE